MRRSFSPGIAGLPACACPRSAEAANLELIRVDAMMSSRAVLGLAGREARPTQNPAGDTV